MIKTQIKRGQTVTFKPEWRDAGDEQVVFVAVEDQDGDRVRVMAAVGLQFNPIQVVDAAMLETAAADADADDAWHYDCGDEEYGRAAWERS